MLEQYWPSFPRKTVDKKLFCKSEAWWRKNDSAFSRRLMDGAITTFLSVASFGREVSSYDKSIVCLGNNFANAERRGVFINLTRQALPNALFCFRFRHGLFVATLLFLAGDR